MVPPVPRGMLREPSQASPLPGSAVLLSLGFPPGLLSLGVPALGSAELPRPQGPCPPRGSRSERGGGTRPPASRLPQLQAPSRAGRLWQAPGCRRAPCSRTPCSRTPCSRRQEQLSPACALSLALFSSSLREGASAARRGWVLKAAAIPMATIK